MARTAPLTCGAWLTMHTRQMHASSPPGRHRRPPRRPAHLTDPAILGRVLTGLKNLAVTA